MARDLNHLWAMFSHHGDMVQRMSWPLKSQLHPTQETIRKEGESHSYVRIPLMQVDRLFFFQSSFVLFKTQLI